MLKSLALVVLLLVSAGALINEAPRCQDGVDTKFLFSSGPFHTCVARGVRNDNVNNAYFRVLKCWGWQEYGQSTVPPESVSGRAVSVVAAGARHSCAGDGNGTVTCWGSNSYNQLEVARKATDSQVFKYCVRGDYVADPNARNYRMCEDVGILEYTLESPIGKHECILSDGREGVLSSFIRPDELTDERTKPVYRTDGRFVCSAAQMSAGGHHTCILYGDFDCLNCNTGYVRCYGSNEFGQTNVPECIMDPTTNSTRARLDSETGELVCYNGTMPLVFQQVSAGLFHTCATTIPFQGSAVHCWGDNQHGQIDHPNASYSFKTVSAGAYHSCGITTDGKVMCWGDNTYGQAKNHDELVAEELIATGTFQDISCGASHTCGVWVPAGNTVYGKSGNNGNDGGQVVCWGGNFAGQSAPPNAAKSFITSVSVGWEHSCALSLDDHSLVCWGGERSKVGLVQNQVDTSECISVCAVCITAGPGMRLAAPSPMAVAPLSIMLSLLMLRRL